MSNPATKALNVLDRYWDRSLPVDLDYIAKRLDISVTKTFGIDNNFDISGKLYWDELGQAICEINTLDIIERQRFTLAHEIGHYVLGHGEKVDFGDSLYRNTTGYQSPDEYEANQFAAELIMPKLAVDFYITKKNTTDVEKLAEIFGVSGRAMYFRLKNLRWI